MHGRRLRRIAGLPRLAAVAMIAALTLLAPLARATEETPPPPPAPSAPPAFPAPPEQLPPPTTPTPLLAPPAPAPKHHRLEWDERWHRFRTAEYISTAVTGVGAIGVFLYASPSDHPKWVGPILFDSAVRNALVLHSRAGLQTAADASGYLALVTPTQALFDSLILPTIDGNLDLTWQLGMMDAQAYALSGLITASLYDTTGRARPDYSDCKAGTSVNPLCNSGPYASFPSGHMAAAMTGAGLICAHHGALPLYGGGAADVIACIDGLTVATGVGVMRMMADRHYASDVLVGGAIGFFSGYGLPRLLHYWKRPINEVVNRSDFKAAVAFGSGASPLGAQLYGVF